LIIKSPEVKVHFQSSLVQNYINDSMQTCTHTELPLALQPLLSGFNQ